jgi:hypothetical protein
MLIQVVGVGLSASRQPDAVARGARANDRQIVRRGGPPSKSGLPAITTRVGSPPVCESMIWMRCTVGWFMAMETMPVSSVRARGFVANG